MKNFTLDSKDQKPSEEVTPIKKERAPLDLTSQKERIIALHAEFTALHKEYPRTELYNMVTYFHDMITEIKKIEIEKYLNS